jgi:antitoxin CptB
MNDLETAKKKIIYKASHRSSKEMDILLGKFTMKYIDLFDEIELTLFDEILECEDEEIYQWILGKNGAPQQPTNRVLQLLKDSSLNHL